MPQDSDNESDISHPKANKMLKTAESTLVGDSSYAEESYLELQKLSHHVDQQFTKLTDVDKSLLDAIANHRKLAGQNWEKFIKDFPTASGPLRCDLAKTISENHILIVLELERFEQEHLFGNCRDKLARMKKNFEHDYPNFKPRDGNYSITSRVSSPATYNEEIIAFFSNASHEEVIKAVPNPTLLPRFKFIPCEKCHSRAGLPLEYLVRINGANLFPHNIGINSYDTAQVVRRITQPSRRCDSDSFITGIATVWVLDPKSKRFEPRLNQRVVTLGGQVALEDMLHEKSIYVEISRKDLKYPRAANIALKTFRISRT
ncbi:hypothetical protein EYC80_008193 [Monilinia laxa]|uniref:Uncharacterized protein n=1 Tax=Monilinia laxa TaxID=61186 RepID=A0A5N6JTT3_MONLA|nr:hypothetical protein EYC80_008193 [Monilinia laxa]